MRKTSFAFKGKTTDGKPVVTGLYRFRETHGIELDVILDDIHAREMMPCWLSLYLECKAAGMKETRIPTVIENACSDSAFGPELGRLVGLVLRRVDIDDLCQRVRP